MKAALLGMACALGLAQCAVAGAQAVALPDALKSAAAQAEALQTSLPSFTCNVAGFSEVEHKGRLERHTTFHATVRAQREPDGRMHESIQYSDVDGQPYTERKRPYFVYGGFTDVLTYLTPALQSCSVFTPAADGSVEFRAMDPPARGCGQWSGMTGSFREDADGNVTHVERRLPERDDWDGLVPFAAVDLKPVDLNGKTFRLAAHIRAEQDMGSSTQRRFEADYTDCRLFATQMKILPGVVPVEEGKQP